MSEFNLFSSVNFIADVSCTRTGRMEAKGCATSCVWKDARRRFYWALRARLARSRILSQFATANPLSTPEFRAQLLTQLAPPDDSNTQRLAEKLEKLDVSSAISSLRSQHVADELKKASGIDRKAALKGLLSVLGEMSDEEKAAVMMTIQSS